MNSIKSLLQSVVKQTLWVFAVAFIVTTAHAQQYYPNQAYQPWRQQQSQPLYAQPQTQYQQPSQYSNQVQYAQPQQTQQYQQYQSPESNYAQNNQIYRQSTQPQQSQQYNNYQQQPSQTEQRREYQESNYSQQFNACINRWNRSGMRVRYERTSGCTVEVRSGMWVPESAIQYTR